MLKVCDNTEELLRSAKSGDKEAEAAFVEKNIGLVRSIIKKFSGRGLEADDLYQLGMLGLYKAVMKFDYGFNVKFSTYAVPMIAGEIKRYLRDNNYIKVSRSIKENSYKIKTEAEKFEMKYGREPKLSELSELLEISIDDIVMAMSVNDAVYSLDTPISDEDSALMEKLADEKNTEEKIINSLTVKELLGMLEVRERQIIIFRYFNGKTQQEVAKKLNISQVQVSRIEKKVLNKLRECV